MSVNYTGIVNPIETKPGFLLRQFSSDVTRGQLRFDVVVGVIAPILCFVFDPIVFTGRFGMVPFGLDLSRFKILVYFFSAISILTLVLWLFFRDRSGSAGAVIAGILVSGSLASLIIGIIILPLSIFGLLFLIGILGFTPFLVSFVYLRNGVRAFNTARPFAEAAILKASFLVGAFLITSPPALVHWHISRIVTESMNHLLRGDLRTADAATQSLRSVAWATDLDPLVRAYARETDQTRKGSLAKAYKEITGKDIETRLDFLLD